MTDTDIVVTAPRAVRNTESSMTDTAIKVTNLGKCYQIYNETQTSKAKRSEACRSNYPRLQRLTRQTLKQYFREFWALKDVAFEVKKGETGGIIWLNGSGKSTLLQLFCGKHSPTSGGFWHH